MGWERRNSKMYFYQHRRRPDGRKQKVYYGSGFQAHMAANFLAAGKIARRVTAKAMSQLKAVTQEAEELSDEFSKGVSELLAVEMLIAGFHNSRSRGWRKMMTTNQNEENDTTHDSTPDTGRKSGQRKGTKSAKDGTSKPESGPASQQKRKAGANPKRNTPPSGTGSSRAPSSEQIRSTIRSAAEQILGESLRHPPHDAGESRRSAAESPDNPLPPPKPVEEMSQEELISAARSGESRVMDRLRPLMHQDVDHYAALADCGDKSMQKWFDAHCGLDLYDRECLTMNIAALRNQHLAEGDSPIERLLIEEILVAWMRHQCWVGLEADTIKARQRSEVLKFSMAQLRSSQRMYLKALAELRDYRRLKIRLPPQPESSEAEET